MPTLHDFLATGSLDPLHFGMTADEVVTALGQPEDESVSMEAPRMEDTVRSNSRSAGRTERRNV